MSCGAGAPKGAVARKAAAHLVESAVCEREDVRSENFEQGEVALRSIRQLVLQGQARKQAGPDARRRSSAASIQASEKRRRRAPGLGRCGCVPLPPIRAGGARSLRYCGTLPRVLRRNARGATVGRTGCEPMPALSVHLKLVDEFPERALVHFLHHGLELDDLVKQTLRANMIIRSKIII